MPEHEDTSWDDTILPFQLEMADMRGRVARLDQTLEDILDQHDYPAEVEALIAEAVTLTALIGQTMELRWKLSLQIRGDGPIRIIATDYFAPESKDDTATIRAYASFDANKAAATQGAAFTKIGKGMFAILIDQGNETTPYQGITPLAGGSLSACAQTYFAQSEQLPTRFAVAMAKAQQPGKPPRWRAGGIMVQHMPKASPLVAQQGASEETGLLTAADLLDGDDQDNWRRINLHLDTAEDIELLGPHVTPVALLTRMFHEDRPMINTVQSIKFGCSCSADKVCQAMSIYSAKDIAHMTTDDGKVTADCQFCGAHYEFDPKKLGFATAT